MASKFQNLDKAKLLIEDANKLASFHKRFEEATKKGNKGQIDKYTKGFNADDRFKAFKTEVYFSAYTGAYGSSSVGSFLYLYSGEELGNALIQYLSDDEEHVLKGMARILDAKARGLVSMARNEIALASELLDDIEKA